MSHLCALVANQVLSRIRAFLDVLSRLLLRHWGFYPDFVQISAQKIGGWDLCLVYRYQNLGMQISNFRYAKTDFLEMAHIQIWFLGNNPVFKYEFLVLFSHPCAISFWDFKTHRDGHNLHHRHSHQCPVDFFENGLKFWKCLWLWWKLRLNCLECRYW